MDGFGLELPLLLPISWVFPVEIEYLPIITGISGKNRNPETFLIKVSFSTHPNPLGKFH